MKDFDINDFASNVFSGLMLGVIIGGHAGKNWTWVAIGGLIGVGMWATEYFRDQRKKEKHKVNDQP